MLMMLYSIFVVVIDDIGSNVRSKLINFQEHFYKSLQSANVLLL